MTREEALNTLMKMRAWRAWGKEQKEEERPEMPEQKEVDEAFDVCIELLQQPSLPSNLDEAAKKIVIQLHPCMEYSSVMGDQLTMGELVELVKAGAEWMAGQGWKEVSATDYPKPDRDKIYCVYTQKDYPHYLLAKVINHPDDDELLQWKCTQFPFTRYDMCEGDSYLEIRKKQ